MDNAPASTFVPATVAASPSPSSSRPIRVPVVATRDPSNGDAGPLRIMMNHAPPDDAEARRAVYETLVQDAGLEVDRGYNVIILEPRLFSTVVTKYEEPPRREEPPPTVQPSRKRIYEAHESSALRMTICVQNDAYVVPPLLPSPRRRLRARPHLQSTGRPLCAVRRRATHHARTKGPPPSNGARGKGQVKDFLHSDST